MTEEEQEAEEEAAKKESTTSQKSSVNEEAEEEAAKKEATPTLTESSLESRLKSRGAPEVLSASAQEAEEEETKKEATPIDTPTKSSLLSRLKSRGAPSEDQSEKHTREIKKKIDKFYKTSGVTKLVLSNLPVGEQSAEHIVTMIATQFKLEHLEMKNCHIGDDGAIKILDTIQRNKRSSITYLDLSGDNNLTKRSASSFDKTTFLKFLLFDELKVDWVLSPHAPKQSIAKITEIKRFKDDALYSKKESQVLSQAKLGPELILACKKSGKPLLPLSNEDKRKYVCSQCKKLKVAYVGCMCCNANLCKGCSVTTLAKQFCEIKILEELCQDSTYVSDKQSLVDTLNNSSLSRFERRTKALTQSIDREAAKSKARGKGITKEDVMKIFNIVSDKQFSNSKKDQEKKKQYVTKKKRVLSTTDCWNQAIEIKDLQEQYKKLHSDGEENSFHGKTLKGVDMWKQAVAEAKDNRHSPLRPEQYVKFRLIPELNYYRTKLPTYSFWRTCIHSFTVAASLFGSVHSLIPLDWTAAISKRTVTGVVMLLSCSSAALVAWSNFSGFEKKMERYSGAVSDLVKKNF